MKKGIHFQDVLVLGAGVYAMLSPLWTTTTDRATLTVVVLGAAAALLGLAELMRPDMLTMEGLTALVGVLFIVSPWVIGFTETAAMAWTAWAVGVITLAVGALDFGITRSHHRGETMATSH